MLFSNRFEDLPARLRATTEAVAVTGNVEESLWIAHSATALDAALKIEALEREVKTAFEQGLRAAADEVLRENQRCLNLSSLRVPAMPSEIREAILKLIPDS